VLHARLMILNPFSTINTFNIVSNLNSNNCRDALYGRLMV